MTDANVWNLHDQIIKARRAADQVKQSGMRVYPRTALYVWKLKWLRYGEDLRRAHFPGYRDGKTKEDI